MQTVGEVHLLQPLEQEGHDVPERYVVLGHVKQPAELHVEQEALHAEQNEPTR